MAPRRSIHIQGARTHNLKNISCDIPHGKMTVITGPSGSGKSSLAFDTLYAEGQRRFMESMSTYARQFLERIEKPDVDHITHILPAIALEQKNHIKNARSTVGTATEIYDFLRILYATMGQTTCDVCGGVVTKFTVSQIESDLKAQPNGTKLILTVPIDLTHRPLETLLAEGYFRAWIDHQLVDLNQGLPEAYSNKSKSKKQPLLEIIVDRLVLKGEQTPARLRESLRKAFELSNGRIHAYDADQSTDPKVFQTDYACVQCHKVFAEPFPNLFSFNNPLGACPTCEGFGRIIGLDLDKVLPNRSLTIREGVVHPFNTPANAEEYDSMLKEAKKKKIRLDVPYESLTHAEKTFVLTGSGQFGGVHGFFEWLETKKYKVHVRVMLAKYRGYYLCPDCNGARIRPEALRVNIAGHNIQALCQMPINQLLTFFNELPLTAEQQQTTERLQREMKTRLTYLQEIGLGYLTLARQSRTLSGGEAQRINLSAALGSALTDTLYVLDEPTVGLHARDTQRLLGVLHALRDLGNTVVVVEHDPEMILGADRILDIGPTGGREGGHIVYEGDKDQFLDIDYSQTAFYIKNPPQVETAQLPLPKKSTDWITVKGASGNNLKHLDIRMPKNRLVCFSGVSGSGKSTFVKQTLYANYQQLRGHELTMDAAPYKSMTGLDEFKDVILVDQSPPGRSVRSNPVTYVKAYDEIRKLYAGTRQAKALGITASHFSFNTTGGRCETCEGLGTITIDMQFMADVTVTCNACQGKRFSPTVLGIEFEGKNINDVLNLTVDDALTFFHKHHRVVNKLWPLKEIGLGYLQLGQSTSTLSGGEAQRLKLASYLMTPEHADPYLFLFDEPTTGLHLTDIHTLVAAVRKLLTAGHSIIVVEHNIEFLAHADYLLELGPEGGEGGGYLIAEGAPKDVANDPKTITGPFLKERLASRDLIAH